MKRSTTSTGDGSAPGWSNALSDLLAGSIISSPPTDLSRPPHHLLLGEVLDMRGHIPAMPVRIFELPRTIPIDLIFDHSQRLGSALNRPLERAIGVLDVDMNRHGSASDRLRAFDTHRRVLVGEHDHSLTNLQLGVTQLAVRSVQAHALASSKHALVELDRLAGAVDDQIGHHLRVVVRYRLGHDAASLDVFAWRSA